MLHVEDLSVSYPEAAGPARPAVDRLSLAAPEGRVLALLGPSGCGKSTTLRAIAGLLRPQSGRIRFGDRAWFDPAARVDLPAARRDIGFMFQSYAIWPHMTVLENAAFPLTVRRPRAGRALERSQALDVLRRLGLAEFAGRPATELSGGQQQRLALARALVHRPRLLLLDEPLSNVEPGLRTAMADELRELQRETGITMVLVTHDHAEALALSDEIAVMREGRLQQQGSPEEVYQRPVNAFVAGFVGQVNLLEDIAGPLAEVAGLQAHAAGPAGLLAYRSRLGPLLLPAADAHGRAPSVGIRPESVRAHAGPPPPGTPNVFQGRVRATAYLGDRVEIHALVGDVPIIARQGPDARLADGAPVWLELPPALCLRFPEAA